jgi:hypothetical protein
MILSQCSKERIEKPIPISYFNIFFTSDTITSIYGFEEINYTGFQLKDSIYEINIANIQKNIPGINGSWFFKLRIPGSLFKGNGKYYLDNFKGPEFQNTSKISTWFFRNYYYDTLTISSLSFYSRLIKNQNSSFDLFNVTDTTLGFSCQNLLSATEDSVVIAKISCNLTLNSILYKSN